MISREKSRGFHAKIPRINAWFKPLGESVSGKAESGKQRYRAAICNDLARFEPFGADISGGVETDKIKDREKILAAVRAARK